MKPFQRIAPHQFLAAVIMLVRLFCLPAFSQETSLMAMKADSPDLSPVVPAPVVSTPAVHIGEQHRFWDTKNRVLFAAVAASSTADFAVTRANLQEGGRELNPVTRLFGTSTAGLALNFAGE